MSAPTARPAWYALETGGWRDYVTLLHLPYTAWHLSYVVIGGCLAPVVAWGRLGAAVLAFALAVGIGAHALDELQRTPAANRHPELDPRRARRSLRRSSLRDRRRRRRDLRALARAARSGRALPRRRVQPRARRRALPLRPLVRARVGRLSGRVRIRRRRRRSERRRAPRGRIRRRPLARAARALEPRALRPPARRVGRGRARASRRGTRTARRRSSHRSPRSEDCACSRRRPSCSRPLWSPSESRVSA